MTRRQEHESHAASRRAARASAQAAEDADALAAAAERYCEARRRLRKNGREAPFETRATALGLGLQSLQMALTYLGGGWYNPPLNEDLKAIRQTSRHQPAYATARDMAALLRRICNDSEAAT